MADNTLMKRLRTLEIKVSDIYRKIRSLGKRVTILEENPGGGGPTLEQLFRNQINPQYLITYDDSMHDTIIYNDDLDPVHSFSMPVLAAWEGKRKTITNDTSAPINMQTYSLDNDFYTEGVMTSTVNISVGKTLSFYNNGLFIIVTPVS